jgi:glycosyltransferase involved in cell wall biosynthesis
LGCLDRFLTSGYYKPTRWPDCLVRYISRIDRGLKRRYHQDLNPDKVIRGWSFELPELLSRRVGASRDTVENHVFHRDAKFDRWVARHWASHGDVFWGFQGACLESLKAARAAGKFAVLELATVHSPMAIRVLQQEAERHPEWADTISNYYFPQWYRERLEAEPHAADLCVVASPYTRESLLDVGVPDEKIRLLPLGAQLDRFVPIERKFSEPKLKILFVGGVGQRKGIKYLLDAVKRLGTELVQLTIAGPAAADLEALHAYEGYYNYLGRVDQTDLVAVMHDQHVMVLPSVLEGFGLVIPEAMATGLPVISSTHSAAPEIIRDGVDGYVLEPDDVDGLSHRLKTMAENRELCRSMSKSAMARAREYSWERHEERLEAIVREIADLMTVPPRLEINTEQLTRKTPVSSQEELS